MDQTHTQPLFKINKPLGFYWGMLSGLNTGLSVWDITKSALEYAKTSKEVQNVFRFFNKYAPQIYPSTATAAYCIFHEGLNSENTTKFPEAQFGEASKGNEARYEAICAAYSDRGAKMDDPHAATMGQVWQRKNQTGYNDAGWSIEEGNYERWIEQINPDYKTYVKEFYDALADAIASWSQNVINRLAFIQPGFGATGDRALYKGDPIDAQYAISDAEYVDFMKEMAQYFVGTFVRSSKTTNIRFLWNLDDYDGDPVIQNPNGKQEYALWMRNNYNCQLRKQQYPIAIGYLSPNETEQDNDQRDDFYGTSDRWDGNRNL